MVERNDEVRDEERSRGGGRVTIDRPAYDELQFEENFHPRGYQRLKVRGLNSNNNLQCTVVDVFFPVHHPQLF